jgi:hypothetical protein
MTHTIRPNNERAPTPLEQRRWWRTPWLFGTLAALILAAVILVGALWPDDADDEVDGDSAASTTAAATSVAPATSTPPPTTPPTTEASATTVPSTTSAAEPGTLAWKTAIEPPGGQVLAVTAMDDGYLAASHTSDGAEFWVSDEGDIWTRLATNPEAFRPNYQVYVLHSGPAGFTAEAFDPTADMTMGTNAVFASTDGATWYRTDLIGDLPESPSKYVIQHSVVHGVTIGSDGFLAFGSGSMMPDFDLIATEYAPGYSSEDVWAVDAEMRSDGAVLIIGFGDEAPLEIPFSELGIEAEDMEAIFEEEGGEEPAISQFLWWSADGETWEPITPQGLPEFWLLPFMMGSVGTDDGFYLFAAGPDPNDPEGSGVMSGYHSVDGRLWTEFELQGPAEDWMRSVDFGDGLFVAAGEDEAGRALWTSTDAKVWERASGSEALFDIGYEGDYAIEEVDIGRAGFVAVGYVHGEEEMYPLVPVEPVVAKDGYAVTFGEDGLTIEDEATGEVEVFDMETGSSPSIQIRDGEIGLTFVDIATGETLLVITNEEIETAWNALAEESGAMGQRPDQVFRYSTDLTNWTLATAEDLFGDGAFAVSGDMGGDTCVAVAASDIARWEAEPNRADLPPTVIWIATPGG